MDYLHRFCQTKSLKNIILLSTLLMGSCVKRTIVSEKVDAVPAWLKTEERFSSKDRNLDTPAHLFFDLVPFHHTSDNGVNYVVTSPVNGHFGYELDLHSGRLFKKHNYCKHDDVWKSYSGTIYRPPFSIAFVPRMLDQLGKPQKIIVFGDERNAQKFSANNNFSQRARIVGGYVEQYCKDYPCKTRKKWMSRLVLVGVNFADPDFKNVYNLKQLKKEVDWKYVKAFVENGEGRNVVSKEDLPAYRMVGEISAKKAFAFSIKNGHRFEFKEMKSLSINCRHIYDYVWKNATELRTEEGAKKNRFRNFTEFFKDFHENHRERFLTCQKYVRSTNINYDRDRHWFFAMFASYFHAEQLNYVYNCSSKSWLKNPTLTTGKQLHNPGDLIKRCDEWQMDRAFDGAITLLSGLYRSNLPHFRYIEYDDFRGGSHEKLYSWIYDSGKKLSCQPKFSEDIITVFPKDINWKPYAKRKVKRGDFIR